jgi:DNA repair photolyase
MIIYEPKGRAAEYSPLAANLYRGCGHSCAYCYAPRVLRMKLDSFQNAQPRSNILRELEKDAKQLKGDTRSVLLCFTCDPYQPIDIEYKYTRRAIEILHQYCLKVTILTKGGKRSERDFDLLKKHPELSVYAATIVFTNENEEERQMWEPYAAPTQERIEALKKAHKLGIETWVSLEPVFNPEDAYNIIERTYPYVDMFKVGTLNHHKKANEIDWHTFLVNVVDLLESKRKKYYIKNDLKAYI